ncbi:MAG: S16 family serine protease [Acidimicrobiales bacterium]
MSTNDHPPKTKPGTRRWPAVLVTVAAVLVVAVVVSSRIELNYYVLTPGVAQPVAPLVSVPKNLDHHLDGTLLLTDVYVSQVTLLDYLPDMLNGDAQVLGAATLLGPYTPPGELTEQGYIEMAQSQSAAKAAALSRLGYRVTQKSVGAMLFAVTAGSPASSILKVGQIITAVNGVPTPSACSVVAAVHPDAPGTVVHLSVQQSVVTTRAILRPGRTVLRSVRLGRRPSANADAATGCPGVRGPSRSYLGVVLYTQLDFTYPVPVSISTSDIGGPSAGLAMTLGIIDKLGGGKITGGRRVAATGTIDPQGQVGDVGGVAEKTIAVERAGATVFFVPPQEYRAAMSKDVPSLHVYAVSSLDQALSILQRLGGQVPPARS